MEHLFICTIGPVQDFIATARRSRDLWFGSWMLSELSRTAAQKVVELYAESLVFPSPALVEPGSHQNIPNKIVAIIDGDPVDLGIKVQEAISTHIEKMGEDSLVEVKGNIDRDLARKQIKDLPEFYWVSVPFNKSAEYPTVRAQAEALMSARKSTRNFPQVMGDYVPKSSLDGMRESVIPESEYPKLGATDKLDKNKNLYKHYHARPGERLSGVDILKRMGASNDAPKFPSTSDMAALPFLEQVEHEHGNGKGQELLDEINILLESTSLNIGEVDGSLIFESRLSDLLSAEVVSDDFRKQFLEIRNEYAGDKQPNPYYALLAADGDNMGVVIDAQVDPSAHRRLSGVLSDFSDQVHRIVGEYQGVPIYSGGDDVLAYLPLHTVLECAKKLEETFKDKLSTYKVVKGNKEISPTLSVGIVVAHHLEPLSDVLASARTAEKEAKKIPDKNGFAITISKHSGANRTISGKWGTFDIRLNQLIKFAKEKAISKGTAYELQQLHRVLFGAGIPDGLASEALRIVNRKRESGGTKVIQEIVKDVFRQWIEIDKIPLDSLAKEMIVAGMFTGDLPLIETSKEIKG